MTWPHFGCRRFARLCGEREDRELRAREVAFLNAHRVRCEACRNHEQASRNSLNMLRAMALNVEASESFDSRVVRRVLLDQGRDRLAYWFPALIGAGIAAFGTFALMQLVTASHSVKPFLPSPNSEASNAATPNAAEPRLLLAPDTRIPSAR